MKKSISLLVILILILAAFIVLPGYAGQDAGDADMPSVTLVVAESFGDGSVNDSALAGVERLETEKDMDTSVVECHDQHIKMRLTEAAEASDVVVAVGWQCYEIAEIAPEYPETKFLYVDNTVQNAKSIPNLLCITYAQDEGAFLAGYVAAKSSKNGVIGAVGSEDVEAINTYITGYTQGAKYADPNILVETVYTGDYEDPKLGRSCALSLADQGADVILNVAGDAGDGIFTAAEEKGIYVIGTDTDQKLAEPDYDGVILCSVKKDAGTYIYDTIANYAASGVWKGGKILTAGLSTGYISIAYGGEASIQLVSDSLKEEVEALTVQIVAGEVDIEADIEEDDDE